MTNLFISIHRISIKCKIYTFNISPTCIVSRKSKILISPYFTRLYSIFINMVCPITPFCPISRKITILHTRKEILIRKKAATNSFHGNPTITPVYGSRCLQQLFLIFDNVNPMQEMNYLFFFFKNYSLWNRNSRKISGFLFPGH